MKTQNKLIEFLAKACHYAQEHIDDADAWPIDRVDREQLLQCTSFQVACFLAQNTKRGDNGVDWDVVLDNLIEHPMKSEAEWRGIIKSLVRQLGGLK